MAYSEILSKISTVFELKQLVRAIDGLKSELYKTNSKYDQVFDDNVPVHLSQALRQVLPKERDAQAEYLDGLRKGLDEMPVVSVTTAYYPSEGFLLEISSKLNELMGTNTVVDIRVSRLILGGARVEYQGRVRDYSVRHRLTELLESRSDEIASWGLNG